MNRAFFITCIIISFAVAMPYASGGDAPYVSRSLEQFVTLSFDDPLTAQFDVKTAVQTPLDAGETQQEGHVPNTTSLPGPPAALLMIIQGLACIALIRGRHKWLVIADTAFSLGSAGIHALPTLVEEYASEPVKSPITEIGAACHAPQRLASDAHTHDLDFVALLKHADSEPIVSSMNDLQSRFTSPATPCRIHRPSSGDFIFVPASANSETVAAIFHAGPTDISCLSLAHYTSPALEKCGDRDIPEGNWDRSNIGEIPG